MGILRESAKKMLLGVFTGLMMSLNAQDQVLIDSFEALIASPETSDSLIAESYKQIAVHLIEQTNSDQVLPYIKRLEQFSKQTPYPEGIIKVYFYTAYLHYRRGRHDSVLIYTGKLAELARKLDRPIEEARALNRMAVTSNVMGHYADARKYFDASLQLSEEIGDSALMLSNFLGSATLEKSEGNYVLAIEMYLMIDSMFAGKSNRDHYRIGLALHNVGLTYLEFMQDQERALEYLLRAKGEYDLYKSESGLISSVNVDLARVYTDQGQYILADSLFAGSLADFRRIGHTKKLGETAMKYSALKIQQEDYEGAERLLQEAESVYENLHAPISLADVYHQLGSLKRTLSKEQEAVKYFNKSIAVEVEPYQKQKSLRALAEMLDETGDYRSAFETLESYVQNQDSLNEAQLKEALQEAEVRYESSQKEQEILALQFTQAQQRSRNQRNLFAAGGLLGLLAVTAFVFYYRARQRQKTNAKLRELDDLKSKLFANISHEFRTPLSLIKGPVDLVLNKEKVDDGVRQQLQVVQRNSVRLTRLIDSVSELARLDAGKINLQIGAGKLSDHLKIIAASFESLAQSRGCTFEVSLPDDQLDSHYDPEIIETIVYNLLSNAFKYAPEGKVELKYDRKKEDALISVGDNGPGLSEEDKQRVFDRYFRVDNREQSAEGIGIGLALSYEFAKLHHGDISLVSELGKGSTFTFNFPVSASSYPSKEITRDSSFVSTVEHTSVAPVAALRLDAKAMHEDELVILLVEDNPDMRSHLEQLFSEDYRILLAEDGEQGMEMAQEFVPDLVISDMMMPRMDGKEFIQRLRSEPKTSHIPFIMLTANKLETEKLSSIQYGVDDFMTKPFSIDEIKLKVESLIRLRQQLQEKYAESSVVNVEKLAANDADARFWQQTKDVINEHLDNPKFSTEDFAHAMYMSRMQLHRKLKALTGSSAAAFVRHQRLNAAARMLKQKNSSVTEVAFDVGFSSPFYFSKCFKETFGIAPREYAKADENP